MFKCVNEKVPMYLSENVRYVREVNPRITRAGDQLIGYAFNTRYGANTFFNKVGGIYNNFKKNSMFQTQLQHFNFQKKGLSLPSDLPEEWVI